MVFSWPILQWTMHFAGFFSTQPTEKCEVRLYNVKCLRDARMKRLVQWPFWDVPTVKWTIAQHPIFFLFFINFAWLFYLFMSIGLYSINLYYKVNVPLFQSKRDIPFYCWTFIHFILILGGVNLFKNIRTTSSLCLQYTLSWAILREG